MANDVKNVSPTRKDGKSAVQIFSGADIRPHLKHFRPMGCPVYVLHNALQAGQQIPKWHKHAQLGLYLGHLLAHARSVALVLNLDTGLVSPQFHVKFDEFFETVNNSDNNYPNRWKVLTHFKKGACLNDKLLEDNHAIPKGHQILENKTAYSPIDNEPQKDSDAETPIVSSTDNANDVTSSLTHSNLTQPGKWSKQHKPSQRLRESIDQGLISFQSVFDVYEGHEEYLIQRELTHPLAFTANKADSDTMYMHQAMRQPDRKQFIKAMQDEIDAHTENRHWKVISRTQVPEGVKVLPSVWAMKRKRRISTGEVYKWKARLNLHGGKQEHGINYWETYSATLAWPTIRFLLTQSLIMGWHTRQIDFTLAYPQADAECQLNMEIPKGFNVSGGNDNHCLMILKNIYGQRQAGRVWSLHLRKGLQACGFSPSQVDECVFYKGTVIFMVYVDDAILLRPHSKAINASLKDLRARFKLTEEGDIADYLGLQVSRLTTGSMALTQPQLIASILRDLNFSENTKAKNTPAVSTQLLQWDHEGEKFDEHWDYQSVIRKTQLPGEISPP